VKRFQATIAAALLLAGGCSSSISTPAPLPSSSGHPTASIQHVIIMLQENRSFNTMFMGFPGAETANQGFCKEYDPGHGEKPVCPRGQEVKLHAISLKTGPPDQGKDIGHNHAIFESEYDGGKMDNFGSNCLGTVCGGSIGQPAGKYPYAYVKRSEVQPYWDMAHQYTLADHMFSTATTDSFVAHQQMIAGTTALNSQESLVDTPSNRPWGCDGFKGTVTGVIFKSGVVKPFGGPFPCLNQYKTMADVLDAAGVSWKYYVESLDPSSPYFDFSGTVWDAYDAIKNVRYGPDWKKVIMPNTTIYKDLKNGSLAQVSWVIPQVLDSDHPASGSTSGPSWVSSVVNAVGKSQYWQNTAIVILWDDWGGWYDNVPPPQLDYTSLGMRVPMIVVSPFAKPHNVSKTQYEFGSVLKFIEENFGTGSLGTTDERANSIDDVFNFSQSPIRFQTIRAPYGPNYFLQHRAQPSPERIIEHDHGVPG
jgi:phospholipase C